MKKYIIMLLFVLSVGLLAVSCQKNGSGSQGIIGSWKVVFTDPESDEIGAIWTFGKDNSLVVRYPNGWTDNETYRLEGNTITLLDEDGSIADIITILSQTESSLEVRFDRFKGAIIRLQRI